MCRLPSGMDSTARQTRMARIVSPASAAQVGILGRRVFKVWKNSVSGARPKVRPSSAAYQRMTPQNGKSTETAAPGSPAKNSTARMV